MKEVVIVSGTRTAIGAFGGSLKAKPVVELGSIVMKEVLKKVNLKPVANSLMQAIAPDKLKDQGLIELAYRHPKMRSIHSSVVREGDVFEFGKGTEQFIRHIPTENRGDLTHAYAVVELTTGGKFIEVMNRVEVEKVKNASPSVRRKKSTPWTHGDFEEEMWRKTVTRRALKYAPRTAEMREALALDTAAEMNEPQNLNVDAMIIDRSGKLREDRADVERTAHDLEERLGIQNEGENGKT